MQDVVYGLFNLRKERELAQASYGYIRQDIADIKSRYIALGFHLDEALTMKYYEDFGYTDFYEFCEKNFRMEKTAVSRSINMWKAFAAYDENSYSRKLWVDEKYSAYNYSQLCEMLPLNEKERKRITPDMTVKEIREKKKTWKQKDASEKQGTSSVATSQPESTESETGIRKVENTQPELPVFKNNNQRKEWLNDYRKWGLWYKDEHIDVNYYKYDFPDGSRLIVAEYPQRERYWTKDKSDEYFFHLLEEKRQRYDHKSTYDVQYMHAPDSETYLVDFLKKLQKK